MPISSPKTPNTAKPPPPGNKPPKPPPIPSQQRMPFLTPPSPQPASPMSLPSFAWKNSLPNDILIAVVAPLSLSNAAACSNPRATPPPVDPPSQKSLSFLAPIPSSPKPLCAARAPCYGQATTPPPSPPLPSSKSSSLLPRFFLKPWPRELKPVSDRVNSQERKPVPNLLKSSLAFPPAP